MAPQLSFEEWLTRLRASDEGAARELFNRYARALIARAQQHLDERLRGKVDAEDVVQSVLRTFCVRMREGQFELIGWDSLWGLLARITVRKCGKWGDHYHAQQRDVKREQPATQDSDAAPRPEPIAPTPGPAEAEALRETMDRLLCGLNELEQKVFLMKLEAPDIEGAEIARQLGCSQAKVSRVLTFVRERLERLRNEDLGLE